MSNFQEAVFLKYQRQYRIKHTRKARRLSGVLVSLALGLVTVSHLVGGLA
ncbi:hypothetical protein [Endozoicomonas sp. GU-1]|nr:hypothetical protein [Endozoicomonas sp. GU-1]WBA86500.1 hypothetical protein O3276_00115 [Endozoicomonas sp. GU-1]